MKTLFATLTLILSLNSFCEVLERSCTPNIVESVQVDSINITFNGMRGSCKISYSIPIRELNGHDTYRTFIAGSEGIFGIFSSFHNPASSKSSSTTGQKTYDLQPVKNGVSIKANSSTGEIELSLASGEKVYLNHNSGLLDTEKTTDLKFSEDPNITNKNQSGVLLISRPGIIFDIPYRQGGNPLALEDKEITIRDPQNKKCTIKIKEIYDTIRYDYDSDVPIIDNTLTEAKTDRYALKASGAELIRLINSKAPKCKSLDLSSLENSSDVAQIVNRVDQINTIAPTTGSPSRISRSPAVINSARDSALPLHDTNDVTPTPANGATSIDQ